MTAYVLVVLVALLNVLSVTAFKSGVARAGGVAIGDFANPAMVIAKIATTPLLLIGIATSICTTVLWLATLTRLPASVALPLMNGVFYLLLLGVSSLLLGEALSFRKVVAVGLILVAAVLLTQP